MLVSLIQRLYKCGMLCSGLSFTALQVSRKPSRCFSVEALCRQEWSWDAFFLRIEFQRTKLLGTLISENKISVRKQ